MKREGGRERSLRHQPVHSHLARQQTCNLRNSEKGKLHSHLSFLLSSEHGGAEDLADQAGPLGAAEERFGVAASKEPVKLEVRVEIRLYV